MKIQYKLILLFYFLFTLYGCAGSMMDSMGHSSKTGKTYTQIFSELPPIKDGYGRLFIYRTKDSTKTSLKINYGLQKNNTGCSIDDTAYQLIWESFRYIDLPVGQHEITCGKDVITSGTWKLNYKRGANKVNIEIKNSNVEFLRVDWTKEYPYFIPIITAPEVAESEIRDLPIQIKPPPVNFKTEK